MATRKKFSIKFQTLIVLLIVWGLLFVLITVYSRLTRETLISEIQQANENMLGLYSAQLDSLCTEINRCLASIDLKKYPEELSQSELSEQLSEYVLLYDDRFSFCFYDTSNASAILRVASNITYSERNDILQYLNRIENIYSPGKWQTSLLGDHYYLMQFYHEDHYYVGAWISLDNALRLYRNNQFAKNTILFFSDADYRVLTNTDSQGSVHQEIDTDSSRWNREYLHLSNALSADRLYLSLLIPYSEILSSFSFITIIQWVIIALFALSVLVMIYYINYFLFRPLKQLSDAMKEVETGNYQISLPSDEIASEYQAVYNAFNDMVREIDYLKTSVYEREIFNQQLELEKLQLQVKPHFYLNCLNIIFNLAQGGEYQLIQDLCMAQIKYFRYMLKSSFTTVTIKDEFDHIRNYLHIQEVRYPGRYNPEISLSPDVESILIPPLILHVFAENVVNHVSTYGKINFSMSARKTPDQMVLITIADDGPGFPEDVLERLQNGEVLNDGSGSHIGISNCIKRLKLYYKEQGKIMFQNRESGGAVIYITIPENIPQEVQNESSDH